MNFLKMLVSSLNLSWLLRYTRLKLRVLVFQMTISQRIPGLNGLSKSIALVQK